jgi:hypothetical protein
MITIKNKSKGEISNTHKSTHTSEEKSAWIKPSESQLNVRSDLSQTNQGMIEVSEYVVCSCVCLGVLYGYRSRAHRGFYSPKEMFDIYLESNQPSLCVCIGLTISNLFPSSAKPTVVRLRSHGTLDTTRPRPQRVRGSNALEVVACSRPQLAWCRDSPEAVRSRPRQSPFVRGNHATPKAVVRPSPWG